jgi:hypothetical protein
MSTSVSEELAAFIFMVKDLFFYLEHGGSRSL